MSKTEPIILGIESSCDDTSIAILKNQTLLSNVTASQKVHEEFGGVVPELASRAHQSNIVPTLNKALKDANVAINEIDAIAVTKGPGLLGSLVVGVSFAKGLAMANNIPIIGIDHMQAHILAHFIKQPNKDFNAPKFPFLCLTVSGGHSQIIKVNNYFEMELIGQTKDDAAGEAFDKISKMLGLPYPGGPHIDRLAKLGDPKKYVFPISNMPAYNYSFSGIKTAVMYFLQKQLKNDPNFIKNEINNICASVQFTIIKMLLQKLKKAARATNTNEIAISGGVAVNSELRNQIRVLSAKHNWNTYFPEMQFCTDNGAMIAIAGHFKYLNKNVDTINLVPDARLKFF